MGALLRSKAKPVLLCVILVACNAGPSRALDRGLPYSLPRLERLRGRLHTFLDVAVAIEYCAVGGAKVCGISSATMLRPRFLGSVLGLLAVPLLAFSASPQRSPLQTIELLHKAFRDADAAAVGLLLHEEYRGVSLQGAPDHRQIYVETQAKAISDVASLKPGAWDVRILTASTQIDPNGLAHVWARYVFYFEGKPDHCGYESYALYQSADGWKVVSFSDTDNPLNGKTVAKVCPLAH
jgi:hypothetical protein